jgi:hypothetical protein
MKKRYVSLEIEVHEVVLEAGIAAQSPVKAVKVTDWTEDEVVGEDPDTDGGYLWF